MDKHNTCVVCNKELDGRKKKYCSKECSNANKRERYRVKNNISSRKCQFCNRCFEPNKNGAKIKYCSEYCFKEMRRKNNRERFRLENGLYEKYGETKDCKMCGVKIEGKDITAVYCSRKCIETHHSRMRGHKPREEYLQEILAQKVVNQELREMERQKRLIELTREGNCKVCGGSFTTLQPSQVTCSTHCSNKWRNRNNDKRINKSNLVDADITLEKLFKRDGGTCYICNGGCDFNDYHTTDSGHWYAGEKYPSIDHLLPLARDGKHAWDNIRLACKRCNTMKSDTLIENILEHVPDNAYALKETKRGTPPKRTAQYDLSGNLIAVYESTGEASKKTNIKRKGIQNCARGECKTYKGFVWSYETTG